MTAYIIRRLLAGLLVVVGVVTLVFFTLHLAPGDPITLLIPADMPGESGEQLAALLRAKYGLDKPLLTQYILYLKEIALLDLGKSIRSDRPVLMDLLIRYPATIELTITSLLLAIVIGIPAGIVAALRPNSALDNVSMTGALLGISIPSFWLALLLMLLFSLRLGWLPASGRVGGLWSWDAIRHIIMPTITLGVGSAAILARLMRSAMLDVLNEDYIRTARSKGLNGRTVVYKHALKNALIPVVTVIGLQFGRLLSGAVIAEVVFAWPGIGRYIVYGITGHDFPVVQGGVMGIAVAFVFVNLAVDIMYAFIDPRITYT